MHPQAILYAAPLFLGFTVAIALIGFTWQRLHDRGAIAFMLSMLNIAAWSVAYALEILNSDLHGKLPWHKIIYTTSGFIPAFWLVFLLQQHDRPKRFLLIWSGLLLIEPTVYTLLTWTNDQHHLLWTSISVPPGAGLPRLELKRAIGFYLHNIYIYLLLLYATLIFMRLLQGESSSLHPLQRFLLVLAIWAPAFANLFHILRPLPINLTPFALIFMGAATGWFAFRYRFWDILPGAHDAIVESMDDGIVVLNLRHIVIEANPAALRFLNLLGMNIKGLPVERVFAGWPQCENLQKILAQDLTSSSLEISITASQTYYIDLIVSNLYDRRRRCNGRLLTLRDITTRKQAELALEEERYTLAQHVTERTADLSQANAQLARTSRLKDEFMANMSHELRTPLNTILGLSEAMQEGVYGEVTTKQERALHNVRESGRHLLSLINDLLDISKIEAGKLTLEHGSVNVAEMCEASLNLVKQVALKKNIAITTQIDSTVKLIDADERRMKQVLVNLLSNAIKFTQDGGQIGLTIEGSVKNNTVQFTVWDTGIGIPQDALPKLFEPFVQLDGRLSRQYEGTGLGLALVHRMVKLHGGNVNVISEVGQGSQFTVSLPWQPDNRHGSVSPIPSEITMSKTPQNLVERALVVDDSPLSADQVSRYLQELGATAHVCHKGNQAMTLVRSFQPDLIVLDLLLPDRSGWEILSELRTDPQTETIPILLISILDISLANDLPVTIERNRNRIGYLAKPFSRQQFEDAVHKLEAALAPLEPLKQTLLPVIEQSVAPQATGQYSAHATRLLLIEDNETNIKAFLDYLHAKGYAVDVARNGAEAFAHLHINQSKQILPDLILMDIQMPDMDGLEITRQIRTDPTLTHIPIIAVTALAMPGDRDRCLAAGATEYLSKPLSLRQLTTMIEKCLLNVVLTPA